MNKISLKHFVLFSLILFVLIIISCPNKTNYGQKNAAATQVKVKDILSKKYIGQEVKLEGRITLECGAGCWFYLEDETGTIYVDLGPSNFAIPQLVGRSVVVNGQAIEKDGQIKMIGKGVNLK